MKKKINVLINEKADYKSYVDFLKIKYDVTLITYSDYLSGKNRETIHLILFTGGEDVNPKLYEEPTGKYTNYNERRDLIEQDIFHNLTYSVPKLGICRGSQFLTVMCGGKLIQHVEGHAIGNVHPINVIYNEDEEEVVNITSTHHQMLFPFNLNDDSYEIKAYSSYFRSSTYLNGKNEETKLPKNFVEPEIVFYPKYNSLAIQGHPESNIMKEFEKEFFLNLITNILKL